MSRLDELSQHQHDAVVANDMRAAALWATEVGCELTRPSRRIRDIDVQLQFQQAQIYATVYVGDRAGTQAVPALPDYSSTVMPVGSSRPLPGASA